MAESQRAAGSSGEPINGTRKAAILMMALSPDASARVLSLLAHDVVEEVTREIASLDLVPPAQRGAVVEEFYNLALARQYIEHGGIGYAKALLEKAMNPAVAAKILRQIEQHVFKKPFAFLAKTDSESLLTFIMDEHPQTIALVLAHLEPDQASAVLASLPEAKQLEVVIRIARMEQTNPEMIKEVEEGLEKRLSGIVSQTLAKFGGVETVAEMLNLADRTTERGILDGLETDEPDLVENIRRLMFVFDDIMLVNDKGIQSVLKEIENSDLGLALKTASEEVREKIFSNMSERASSLIKEDMEYMGPVRVSDVESAQQRIVDVVRRLEDAGELIISGRGTEKEMIV